MPAKRHPRTKKSWRATDALGWFIIVGLGLATWAALVAVLATYCSFGSHWPIIWLDQTTPAMPTALQLPAEEMAPTSWLQYENQTYGVMFKYPPSLRVQSLLPEALPQATQVAAIELTRSEPTIDYTISIDRRSAFDIIKDQPGFLTRASTITVGGVTAVKLAAEVDGTLVYPRIIIQHGKYTITISSSHTDADPAFHTLLASLRLTPALGEDAP